MRTALGFKTHTGWAAVVAVAGREVVAKRRIDLATDFRTGAVFHVGQELPLPQAQELISSSQARFEAKARDAIAAIVEELRAKECEVIGSAIIAGNPKPLPPIESVLKSHALVHAAEGQLYRHVFAAASEACRIPAALVPAKELASRAARAMGISAAELTARIAAMGKASGRPWAADHKESALAALVALGESS
jgi:hypothetical protein